MANQPIPVSEANEMIQNYLDYMTQLNIRGQTQSVSFDSPGLISWMDGVKAYTDEFRICFGVYSPATANEGRMTVIIWPYKDGEPAQSDAAEAGKDGGGTEIQPYNIGGLSP
jgi:hypothetical protein